MELLSRALSHPPSTALFFVVSFSLHCFLREPRKTQEYAEALLTFSTEQGFAQWMSAGMVFQGWALVESGGGESKIEQIRQGLNDWQAIGIELAHPFYRGLIAEGCKRVGLIEKALEEINQALKKVEQLGERENEPRLCIRYCEIHTFGE
jgi:predicted ATPase